MIKPENVTPAKINYDLEKLKANVQDDLTYFKQELENAKDESELKKVRTELNKYIKSANDSRKQIKKDLTAPITKFEKDFKEVEGYFSPLQEEVKDKLDKFEEERKATKHEEIKEIDGVSKFVDYFGFDEKWLNKSTTIKSIEEEIEKGLKQIEDGIKSIESTAGLLGFKDYQKYLDMLKELPVHEIITQMHKDKQWLDKETETEEPKQFDTTEEKHTITRVLKGTKEQLHDLKAYADKIGVEWRKE